MSTLRLLILGWAGLFHLNLAGQTNWVGFQQRGNLAYLLFPAPARIERYDLAGQTWLPAISLTGQATSFLADDSGLYVAFSGIAKRYTLEGTGEQQLASVKGGIRSILAWKDFIYLVYPFYPYGNFLSLNKQTGAVVATHEITYGIYAGASLSESNGKIYGRDEGTSPGDIKMLALKPDGSFGESVDSPYHGDYPSATRTYVFPGGKLVGDNAGIVYSSVDLTIVATLGGPVTDMAFDGSRPIVLRAGKLFAYSEKLLEAGVYRTGMTTPLNLATHSTNVFVFGATTGARGIEVMVTALDKLQPDPPAPRIDPRGLIYTPDQILLDREGNVLLYSKTNANIFRWSASARSYGESIALARLPNEPSHVAYVAPAHRLYLAYESGRLDQVPLGETGGQRVFAALAQYPTGLAAAGEWLFVYGVSSLGGANHLYAPDGSRLASYSFGVHSSEYEWSPARHRLYLFDDSRSGTDLRFEEFSAEGKYSGRGQTPPGGVNTALPIRVNPEGNLVLLGSGNLFVEPGLKSHPFSLVNTVSDAVWSKDRLFTIREREGRTEVQQWQTNTFGQSASLSLAGTPLRLFSHGNSLLVVTRYLGMPRFHELDQDLALQYTSLTPPMDPAGLTVTNLTDRSVMVTWLDQSDNEDAFVVERVDLVSGRWIPVAATAPNGTNTMVSGLEPSTYYDFRVLATNRLAVSQPAGPVTIRTHPDARSPLGPPFKLSVWRVLATSAELSWQDNATNESGFRLERKPPAGTAWSVVFSSGPDATNYLDTSVTPGTDYLYRLRAFNAFADSEISPELAVTTLRTNSQPPSAAPLGLRSLAVTARRIAIGWTDAAVNEEGFIIERSASLAGPYAEIGRIGINAAAFEDAAVEPATFYHYQVRAYNAHGTSPISGPLAARTPGLGGNYLSLASRHGDIAYFAFDGPSRLERHDLARGIWLNSLPLPEPPTALLVNEDGIYLAFGGSVSRFDHELARATHVAGLSGRVTTLAAVTEHLYIGTRSRDAVVINRQTLAHVISGRLNHDWPARVAAARKAPRIFVRDATTLWSLGLRLGGGFESSRNILEHDNYRSANAVWLFPDENRIVDNEGIVCQASDLTYTGSLAGELTDLVFDADGQPVVLRSDKLIRYSSRLLETGRHSLPQPAVNLFLQGDQALAFCLDGRNDHGMTVEQVALSSLQPAIPARPPALYGLTMVPDDVFLDKRNVLHLFSRAAKALFRWNATTREYLDPIGLTESPTVTAYSVESDTIYIGHEAGEVTRIKPGENQPETGFVNLAQRVLGLVAAGEYLVTCDESGHNQNHSTFAPDGTRAGYEDGNYLWQAAAWDPVYRRFYYLRDFGSSGNEFDYEAISPDGRIGNPVRDTSDWFYGNVIRVKPDGSVVVLGRGRLISVEGMPLGTLPNILMDAAWRGTLLHTLRAFEKKTQIQRWSATYTLTGAAELEGTPVRLFSQAAGLLLVTLENGQPRMTLLNEALAITHQTPLNAPPTALVVTSENLPENTLPGTVVARLAATDANPADAHSFALVGGDTNWISLDGANLILARAVDFESRRTLTVETRATDPYGLSFSQPVTLNIADVNEAPTSVELSNATVLDNLGPGETVGLLSATDPDAGDVLEFSLVENPGARFLVRGGRLVLNAPLDALDQSVLPIKVRATDRDGLFFERAFTIEVRRHVAPPPLGEVMVNFNTATNATAPRWEEAGFLLTAREGPVLLAAADHSVAIPASGSGHLRQADGASPLVLAHLTGQKFRLFSLRIAELAPNGKPRPVSIAGRRLDNSMVTYETTLDGAADGPGGIADFQRVDLPDTFSDLAEVTFAGAGLALDELDLHAGPDPEPALVRLVPAELIAFKNPTGIPAAPPYPHPARLGVTRIGSLGQALVCQLSLGGTAVPVFDYFIDGLGMDRKVTFLSGQRTVWLELYPFPDTAAEPEETAVITLEPGAYTIGRERQAAVAILDGPFAGWLARRWEGAVPGAPALSPDADPDRNGLGNFAEWFLGMDPRLPETLRKPRILTAPDGVTIQFSQSRLATGHLLVVEQSADLHTWQAVISPVQELTGTPTTHVFQLVLPATGEARFFRYSARPRR